MMVCPRCGHEQPEAPECGRCGIVVGKYRQADRPRPSTPVETSGAETSGTATSGAGGAVWAALLGCALVGGAAAWRLAHRGNTLEVAAPPAAGRLEPAVATTSRWSEPAAVRADSPARADAVPAPERSAAPAPADDATCPLSTAIASEGPTRSFSPYWQSGADGYARAEREQQEAGVPLLIYFRTDWCPYCKQLDEQVLSSFTVERFLRDHMARVKVNPEDGPAEKSLFDRYGGTGYPTVVMTLPGEGPQRVSLHRRQKPEVEFFSGDELVDRLGKTISAAAQRLVYDGAQRRKAGDVAGALPLLDQAVALQPEDADGYLQRAIARAEGQDVDRALGDLRRALDLRPRDLDLYRTVDWVLGRQQRWGEIAACWSELIAQEPANAVAYFERGGAHHRRGDSARAHADAEKACSLGVAEACRVARQYPG
ncbi:MAG TPA: thioredoxin family protein [Vicinamibacteria bacterium]|nr:thioredoxin family protein [Vicinamibacteria bacterium]